MLHLPFLGGIPHNGRIDTIFMLVLNYLITGELTAVTLQYITTVESLPANTVVRFTGIISDYIR